jgi:hypothetical protein
MYEPRSAPLLTREQFLVRLARHAAFSMAVVLGSLLVGVVGYRSLEGMSWLDALLNASMILGGMGPVNELRTPAGKLFASGYALFSGFLVLIVAGVLIAPVIHRYLHHFHLELDDDRPRKR